MRVVAIENKIIGQNVASLDFTGVNRNSVVQLYSRQHLFRPNYYGE